jgi:hypothetical protein
MSFLPAPSNDDSGLNRRQVLKARKAEADTALELHRYSLGARFRGQVDVYDSQALSDANRAAVSEEMDVLEYGLSRAGASAAKVEMTARALQRMAAINDRRITRRFGGV